MTPEALTMTFQLLFGTGGVSVVIAGIVSLVKSKQEGERLESELQDKMLQRSADMLSLEALRVDQAIARASAAEESADETRKELRKLERAFDKYRREKEIENQRMLRNLDEVYGWIEDGAKPPPPQRPDWLKGL